jgi:hypothetical protein
MENQLQTTSTHQLPIVLNDKENKIAAIVYHVNQLTSYPLSGVQIEDWAKSINELMPDVDLVELKRVINNFKLGVFEWDYRKGIQNIFLAINSINYQPHVINHDDRP